MKGRVHSFETLGALDGPGVRCVVFLQGCPMRCIYCHNPDTWNINDGMEIESIDVVKKVSRVLPYFKNEGGITLSGGEPFMQSDFALDILKRCADKGIHTAVDTSGFYFDDKVKQALGYTDLVLLDIKHSDPIKYMDLTGKPIDGTLSFLEYCAIKQIPMWIRQVIVPGINDTKRDIKNLGQMLLGISSIEKVELIPYHNMGISKWEGMGLQYSLKNTKPPETKKIRSLQEFLESILI